MWRTAVSPGRSEKQIRFGFLRDALVRALRRVSPDRGHDSCDRFLVDDPDELRMEIVFPSPLHHVMYSCTEHHLDPHLDVGNQRWRVVVEIQQGTGSPCGIRAFPAADQCRAPTAVLRHQAHETTRDGLPPARCTRPNNHPSLVCRRGHDVFRRQRAAVVPRPRRSPGLWHTAIRSVAWRGGSAFRC